MAANPLGIGPPSIGNNILGNLASPLAGDAPTRRQEFLEYMRLLADSSRAVVDQIGASAAGGEATIKHDRALLEEATLAATARRLASQLSDNDFPLSRRARPSPARKISVSPPEVEPQTYRPPSELGGNVSEEQTEKPSILKREVDARFAPTLAPAGPIQTESEQTAVRLEPDHDSGGDSRNASEKAYGSDRDERTSTALQNDAFVRAAQRHLKEKSREILDTRYMLRDQSRSKSRAQAARVVDEQIAAIKAYQHHKVEDAEAEAAHQQDWERYRREIAQLIEGRIADARAGDHAAVVRFEESQAEKKAAVDSFNERQRDIKDDRAEFRGRLDDANRLAYSLLEQEWKQDLADYRAESDAEADTFRIDELIDADAAFNAARDRKTAEWVARRRDAIRQQEQDRLDREAADAADAADAVRALPQSGLKIEV